jgi:glycerol-3-phosphate dehydrogenase subunit B
MAIEDDVLVIGGGLAGIVAALAAARTGARCRVVTHRESTLRQASGLVDVLGYLPGDDEPLADPFAAIGDLPDDHPYSVVGVEVVRDGLALFDEIAGDAYRGSHTDRNALVPTFGGSVKPTARYPASTEAGLASAGGDALLVGFERSADFDAPLAADRLGAAGVPFGVRGATVEFPGSFPTDATATRFAHALEDADVRATVAERVRPLLDGESRVGFPAVLGEDDHEVVRADLEDRLGASVFEVPMGPPSLPGMRLQSILETALRDAGVRTTAGNPVVDFDADGGRVREVYADRNDARIPYRAEEYVLATGGLVGKGIDSDRSGVREPVFDCHVAHPEDRYAWFDDDTFGDHPFARFGVQADEELRPLDASGEPEFSNLRAAGAVLGGYDFAAEKSGSGVSIATGYVAGTGAGETA